MMTLAIETSSPEGSIALGLKGELIHQTRFSGDGRHSQALFPALTRIGVPRLKIARVLVGLGPGSFGGIRVGIAAAHGVALAQNAEVWGIPSTYAQAVRHPKVTRLGIFADARRGEYYVSVFALGQPERETYLIPKARLADEVSKMTLALSGAPVPEVPHLEAPEAKFLLTLPEDLDAWQTGPDLQPVYLREAAVNAQQVGTGKRAAPETSAP
ncbi:MAG: tRNA (adenosine(37)-N6)-threonylcarbamoyltransferase complex dimerization subunit type 1 TsaB [Verrucomicrobiota bacterium]